MRLLWKSTWSGSQRARQGASGVNVSPQRPDVRSPVVCCWVKASALTKSPSVALSGRQIVIQHQTHKYWMANRLVLSHHSPERGQNQSGGTFTSLQTKSPWAVRWQAAEGLFSVCYNGDLLTLWPKKSMWTAGKICLPCRLFWCSFLFSQY